MKIMVCFLCNRQMDGDGFPGDEVPLVTQIGLLNNKALKSSLCVVCFRKRYKTLKSDLEIYVQGLKSLLDKE